RAVHDLNSPLLLLARGPLLTSWSHFRRPIAGVGLWRPPDLFRRRLDTCRVSPRSRGRPPGRGRSQKPRRPAARQGGPHLVAGPAGESTAVHEQEMPGCWFDEPRPGDRRSWAVPPAHGTYQGLDLELLDPGDEDERALLIEARNGEFADALQGDDDVMLDGEPVNPRLHVAMHQVVANQLLAG